MLCFRFACISLGKDKRLGYIVLVGIGSRGSAVGNCKYIQRAMHQVQHSKSRVVTPKSWLAEAMVLAESFLSVHRWLEPSPFGEYIAYKSVCICAATCMGRASPYVVCQVTESDPGGQLELLDCENPLTKSVQRNIRMHRRSQKSP